MLPFKNRKTTVAGYIGLAGTVLGLVAQGIPGKVGMILLQIGIVLSGGAAGMGNIASKDGGH